MTIIGVMVGLLPGYGTIGDGADIMAMDGAGTTHGDFATILGGAGEALTVMVMPDSMVTDGVHGEDITVPGAHPTDTIEALTITPTVIAPMRTIRAEEDTTAIPIRLPVEIQT